MSPDPDDDHDATQAAAPRRRSSLVAALVGAGLLICAGVVAPAWALWSGQRADEAASRTLGRTTGGDPGAATAPEPTMPEQIGALRRSRDPAAEQVVRRGLDSLEVGTATFVGGAFARPSSEDVVMFVFAGRSPTGMGMDQVAGTFAAGWDLRERPIGRLTGELRCAAASTSGRQDTCIWSDGVSMVLVTRASDPGTDPADDARAAVAAVVVR